MSADLLLMMVAHRDGQQPGLQAAYRYIENLRASDLERTVGGYAFDDIEGLDAGTDAALVDVRAILSDAVMMLVESLSWDDVSMFKICGWCCYFTGGMTFGDDPSEAFTAFNRIVNDCGALGTEVMEKAGFGWPPQGVDQFMIKEEVTLSD